MAPKSNKLMNSWRSWPSFLSFLMIFLSLSPSPSPSPSPSAIQLLFLPSKAVEIRFATPGHLHTQNPYIHMKIGHHHQQTARRNSTMTSNLFVFMLQRFSTRWPLLIYAITWTIILTIMVAIASFWPELAFVSAITPSSSFSKACDGDGLVRLPLDIPGEVFCFRAQLLKKSKMDMVVPPVFAAVIVASCAYAVKSLALFEVDNEED